MSDSKYKIIFEAQDYLYNLNDKYFKLPLILTCVPDSEKQFTNDIGEITLAQYKSLWKIHKSDPRYKYGEIIFNCESLIKRTKEKVFETVRHELAHAICDIKYNNQELDCCNGHGKLWIRIAKLLRVNTKRYEDIINNEFINCLKNVPPPSNMINSRSTFKTIHMNNDAKIFKGLPIILDEFKAELNKRNLENKFEQNKHY